MPRHHIGKSAYAGDVTAIQNTFSLLAMRARQGYSTLTLQQAEHMEVFAVLPALDQRPAFLIKQACQFGRVVPLHIGDRELLTLSGL